ncbi:conserved hypothetical protein [Theileria orientalis strain Shintoku]|uniref:Uncharacterized protein n=1 Tax=Theileria orientalis strain Shintoku TaxID=869250 RepID=J4D8Q1_THEOR|nr:conserved hypothetical protein [Theileria orientalis strain Shintoku]BAM40920.1 conserved hypothetical protein [Theileria orientalis strain Shintoku]|eukprot:XP_009691221.1 conserved hypothetical protein [Theileria orientalis strain Shintoku]
MQNVIKCIYPKIRRIPQNFSSKCALKSELYENKDSNIHVLSVVCGSHHLNFSPYDSALVLDLLLTNHNKSNGSCKSIDKNTSDSNKKFKSHTLYKPAITRVVDSVINYRSELLPYFFKKFSELHEIGALRSIIFVIVDSKSLPNYNINALIEFCYLTSFHIPSSCFSDQKHSDYKLYNSFYEELVDNITKLINNHCLNKVLLYKLLYSLSRIPFKLDHKRLFKLVFNKLTEVLSNNYWESKYLIQIYESLYKLELLDQRTLFLIYRNIELVVFELNPRDLKSLLSISSKLDDSLSKKLTKVANEKLALYNKLNVK